MRHWLQLGTRNWSASRGAFLATAVAVGLGVALVVSMTSLFDSALYAVKTDLVRRWLGAAHLSIQPPGAHWGTMDASLARDVSAVNNVSQATARLHRRMVVVSPPREGALLPDRAEWVDAIGIDPATEASFLTVFEDTVEPAQHASERRATQGRMIEPGERGVVAVEAAIARDWQAELGDTLHLSAYRGGPTLPVRIVGIFPDQRLADFQFPMMYLPIADVWELKRQAGQASVVEILLDDASPDTLRRAEQELKAWLNARHLPYAVRSAAAQRAQLEEAERLTRLAIVVTSVITLLTAFFIILTTMSASLFSRTRLLGLMRCVGLTRVQLAATVLAEATPPTLIGIAAGLPLGVALMKTGEHWAGEFAPPVSLSAWGVSVALICAAATWAFSMIILMVQVCGVSPMRAATPAARPPRARTLVAAAAVGLALVGVHEWTLRGMDPGRWFDPLYLAIGGASQTVGFALVIPAAAWLTGGTLARLAGPLFGLRPVLARDALGRAPWLSAGVCWTLMVGLGLIIGSSVRIHGVMKFWDFPARLPAAFVWAPDYTHAASLDQVRELPGVGEVTVVADVECDIDHPDAPPASATPILDSILKPLHRPVFVAGDPDAFLNMAKLGFAQSTTQEIREKLNRGGYLLVPPQMAHSRGVGKGDKLRITIAGRSAVFEVADVVESPALDIAVSFFRAETYMQLAAATAVLGTRADLRDKFGLDVFSMVMCNVELAPVEAPDLFQADAPPVLKDDRSTARLMLALADRLPEERALMNALTPKLEALVEDDVDALTDTERAELGRFARAARFAGFYWQDQTPPQNWTTFRERLVLFRIADVMGKPDAIMGSLQRLKDNLERDVQRAIRIITWLPAVALLVASLGIANLITVRVLSRMRQIAILRALGATRSQIVRMVLAESTALGLLGAAAGVALGFYAARSDDIITGRVAGFTLDWVIPWGTLLPAAALTVTVCVLAGLLPARRAARANIIASLEPG